MAAAPAREGRAPRQGAAAADSKDPDALAAAYEDVVVTCMACHWAFLPPEARPAKKDEPKKEEPKKN